MVVYHVESVINDSPEEDANSSDGENIAEGYDGTAIVRYPIKNHP